jgi:dipeptidyl aminopeptidase/acylaminoacyl peptidase
LTSIRPVSPTLNAGLRRLAGAGLIAAAAALVAGAAAAQPSGAAAGLHAFSAVSLSPSGDRVAAVETFEPFAPSRSRARGPVVWRAAHGGQVMAQFDPCPACRYSDPAWSPDGAALAFVAYDPIRGQAMLEVARGGHVATLATVDGVAGTPRFSPDGRRIALMATPGAHKQTGAVEAGAAQVGDIGAVETEDEKRIAVLPASGGPLRYVSPADTFVYEYDWTPDGRGFVATAAKGNGDNNWWVAKLIAVDADSGATRVIAAPKFQINFPRVSPDGRTVAVIGGLMSDFGSVGGDVYTVPLTGGELTDLTPGIKATFTSIAWKGPRVSATLLRGDKAEIAWLDPRSGAVETRWSEPVFIEAADGRASFSADGTLAATTAQDFTHAPEIFAGAPGEGFAATTHDNTGLQPQTTATSVAWKNEGFDVQGWLLAPLQVAPGKHPMIVEVHGGPSAAAEPRYLPAYSNASLFPVVDWLKRGYFVLLPNPRGSYGQGEAFTRANVRDFGGGDLKDILAGIDKVETIAPVDDARLGVFGHSYGGYMTMWTVTHSHRFKAAIAGAGIADWVSYYGENGIDQWMVPFFGASAYDDPAIYEKLSPIFAIKDATTPTFIYVGERDVECPAPQSFEFWHGLKAVGVPTDLVVYAGQGHAIRDPADLADLRTRELDWFAKYLGS